MHIFEDWEVPRWGRDGMELIFNESCIDNNERLQLIAPEDLSTGLGTRNSKLFKYKLFLQLLTCNFQLLWLNFAKCLIYFFLKLDYYILLLKKQELFCDTTYSHYQKTAILPASNLKLIWKGRTEFGNVNVFCFFIMCNNAWNTSKEKKQLIILK